MLTCNGQLLDLGSDLIQLVQIQCQIGCQIHIAVAGGHGEGLVMGLRGQVDSEAVLAACSQLGQSALVVAGHEQVVQVLADDLCGFHIAQRLRRVAGTTKVHQQGGLGAGQEVLRGGNDIGGSVGLDLVVVLGVQSLEQGVANELAGACADQNNIKVILLDDLIDKSLQLVLAASQLCAGLAPSCRLLIDFVCSKSGRCFLHLLISQIKNAHLFLPPNRLVFCPNHRQGSPMRTLPAFLLYHTPMAENKGATESHNF